MTGWSIPPWMRLAVAIGSILTCWALQSLVTYRAGDDPRYDRAIRVVQSAPVSINRCSRCHPGACEGNADAPHSRTLREGRHPEIRARFAGRSFRRNADSPLVSFVERDERLWMTSDAYPEPLPVDWVFGSGLHAMTPVSLMLNPDGATELVEGAVSWFPGDLLGETPGAKLTAAKGIASLGTPHDHPTAIECFGCHTTRLPPDDALTRSDQIVVGIGCERCHAGSERHADSMENGGPPLIERWSELTPLESVNRCGECHRRADHLTREELSPSRPVLVRFASIGMVMSPCFQKQDSVTGTGGSTRFDCVTCHDPHRPVEAPPETFAAKCVQCHNPQTTSVRNCTSPETTANCLGCHMPPVNVTENLTLTDHWIRVRTPSDPPIARQIKR
jgi:predicted CXXCH cytochrome family protein